MTVLAVSALALSACTSQHLQDLDTSTEFLTHNVEPIEVIVTAPDSVEVFLNVDMHPNLARVCIDGIAFLTTTRDLDAVDRVAEWDPYCPKG